MGKKLAFQIFCLFQNECIYLLIYVHMLLSTESGSNHFTGSSEPLKACFSFAVVGIRKNPWSHLRIH